MDSYLLTLRTIYLGLTAMQMWYDRLYDFGMLTEVYYMFITRQIQSRKSLVNDEIDRITSSREN